MIGREIANTSGHTFSSIASGKLRCSVDAALYAAGTGAVCYFLWK
jgi:hypothetical protein